MPRCPDTCPKVIEQKRRLAELAASKEVEENTVTFTGSKSNFHDAEVQNSQTSLRISEICSSKPPSRPPSRSKSAGAVAVVKSKPARICSRNPSRQSSKASTLAGSAIIPPSRDASKGQKKSDGFFDNLCKCSLACMIDQLVKNDFLMANVKSLIFFALGVKLCFELDAWTLPNSFF